MIFSPNKAKDIQWRRQLLVQMHQALKDNLPITAKELGKMTRWLGERIKTHNYTKLDERDARIEKMMKRVRGATASQRVSEPPKGNRVDYGKYGLRDGVVEAALKEIERIFA